MTSRHASGVDTLAWDLSNRVNAVHRAGFGLDASTGDDLLVPGATLAGAALDPANPNDFFLFITNDNDFITQNGYQAGMPYKDASELEVDTMILVYRVTLPVQLN